MTASDRGLRRSVDAGKRAAAATLLVAAAAGIAQLLQFADVPHSSPPYLLAVMFAALYGGTGPGLLATALATIAAAFFDYAPAYSLNLGLDDAVRLASFTVAALVMSSVSASRRDAEQRLRTALAELEQLDRAKDEFLATVSHELRTPLTSFAGWIHLLRQPATDDATRSLALESLEQSTRTQKMLVDDLLDISRIVVGKLRIARQPVDVRTVVASAMDVVRLAAEQQHIVLEAHAPERPVVVIGDADRLQQVVWNLLTNALKFTPTGGQVQVDVESVERDVLIRVRDTGSGVDPAILPVVFERFRQGAGAARKGGLGLGLSIAKEIVTLHGGAIDAANGDRGGAVFSVRLPRNEGDAA